MGRGPVVWEKDTLLHSKAGRLGFLHKRLSVFKISPVTDLNLFTITVEMQLV